MTTFQLALLEEAKIFLEKISPQARKKILYNIWRVAGGERNSELFKKLENSPDFDKFCIPGFFSY